jgi:hypothetical protein
MLHLRTHEHQMYAWTKEEGLVPFSRLPDHLWARHMANFIARDLELGFIRVKAEGDREEVRKL